MKLSCQLFFLGAWSLTVLGQEEAHVTGAKVTEVGIYQAQVITAQTNATGVKLQGLDEFKLLRSATNVPARVGVRFGFRYEILGTPANAPVVLTMVVTHPPPERDDRQNRGQGELPVALADWANLCRQLPG